MQRHLYSHGAFANYNSRNSDENNRCTGRKEEPEPEPIDMRADEEFDDWLHSKQPAAVAEDSDEEVSEIEPQFDSDGDEIFEFNAKGSWLRRQKAVRHRLAFVAEGDESLAYVEQELNEEQEYAAEIDSDAEPKKDASRTVCPHRSPA